MDLRELRLQGNAGGTRHPWELARLEIAGRLIQKHARRIRSILDIGCGDGYLMAGLARRFGAAAAGVDTAASPEETASANRRFAAAGIKAEMTVSLTAARALLPGETADVVLLTDLLEHVEDDTAALAAIAADPATGSSVFIITVPAFMRLFSEHDRQLRHFRRYTKAELERTAGSAGLEILESGYFFTGLAAVRFMQKVSERPQGHAGDFSGVALWKYGRAAAALAAKLLILEFMLTGFLRRAGVACPGLSAYAICKKQLL
ncbi:MAG: class I SAM-dependent methyltransferase [Elusimicrobiaceae bacterium]|nr:class I SAM-dependent methyltransferase [Elusimicrobiaceae bacterium]